MAILAPFLRFVFSASRVQQVSDLHLKFALRPLLTDRERSMALGLICVEVWQTCNLLRLRLGEEKKKKERKKEQTIA